MKLILTVTLVICSAIRQGVENKVANRSVARIDRLQPVVT
jgi:hypothetical protein